MAEQCREIDEVSKVTLVEDPWGKPLLKVECDTLPTDIRRAINSGAVELYDVRNTSQTLFTISVQK